MDVDKMLMECGGKGVYLGMYFNNDWIIYDIDKFDGGETITLHCRDGWQVGANDYIVRYRYPGFCNHTALEEHND